MKGEDGGRMEEGDGISVGGGVGFMRRVGEMVGRVGF